MKTSNILIGVAVLGGLLYGASRFMAFPTNGGSEDISLSVQNEAAAPPTLDEFNRQIDALYEKAKEITAPATEWLSWANSSAGREAYNTGTTDFRNWFRSQQLSAAQLRGDGADYIYDEIRELRDERNRLYG